MRRPVKGFYALPLDRINHTNEANLSASLSVMMGRFRLTSVIRRTQIPNRAALYTGKPILGGRESRRRETFFETFGGLRYV